MHKFKTVKHRSLKQIFASSVLVFCAILFSPACCAAPTSLWQILNYYGFETSSQKAALQVLLKNSGINENELLHKPNKTDDELLNNILQFVKITQQNFSLRIGTQERWEVTPAKWMESNIDRNSIELTAIGLTTPMLPKSENTDVICILGATKTAMQTRMDFAASLYNRRQLNAKYLVLLSGERYINSANSPDGDPQQLSALAKKLNKPSSQLTETDLFLDIYSQSTLYNKLDTIIIDAPRIDLPRPSTQTTVKEFIKWLKEQPHIKSITFISNQPYVAYQKAVIIETFKQAAVYDNYDLQVLGKGLDILQHPNLKQVVQVAGALGLQIYAQTPEVIKRLGLKFSDPKLRKEFIEFYQKQPLVYRQVDQLFN